MKRLLLLAALATLAAAGTACDPAPPAATADGTTITHAALQDQLAALADASNPASRCAVEVLTGSSLQVNGAGQDTVPVALADDELGTMIQAAIEKQAMARHRLTLTAADLATGREDVLTQLEQSYSQGQQNQTLPAECANLTPAALVAKLPKTFADQQAELQARQERLQAYFGNVDISAQAIAGYYLTHASTFDEVCLNLLVADNQANAQTLHTLVTSGTSFAAAASNPAADAAATQSGPQLPCALPGAVTQAFGTAAASVLDNLAVGAVSDPVAVQTTDATGAQVTVYLVGQMRQRQLLPLDDQLKSLIRLNLLQQANQTSTSGFGKILASADVWVDPRYGSWKKLQEQIAAPASPPCKELLSPGIDPSCSTGTGLGALGGLGGPGTGSTGAGTGATGTGATPGG